MSSIPRADLRAARRRITARTIAQLLRGEREALSRQERDEVLRHRISYLADDLVVPDLECRVRLRHRGRRAGGARDPRVRQLAAARVPLLRRSARRRAGRHLRAARGARLVRQAGAGAATRAPRSQVHALFIDVNELTDQTENALKIVGDVYAARLFALVGRAARPRSLEAQRRGEAEDARRHLPLRRRADRHVARRRCSSSTIVLILRVRAGAASSDRES